MESRTNENDFSPDLTCPIRQEIFVDPVSVIPCGHSFEREEITKWAANHSTCPVCVQEIVRTTFVPNISLRNIVEKLLTQHPENLFSGEFVRQLVKDGKKDLIIKIFQSHPEKINEGLVDGFNVLHLAIMEGKFAIIEALFAHFKDIDINAKVESINQSDNGRTPLFLAAYLEKADTDILKFLLDHGADPSISTAKGENALMVAIWNMKWNRVLTLLDSGKDLGINQTLLHGQQKHITPLICAVARNCSLKIFQKLLAIKNIDINARRATGESALFTAAANGQEDKVRILLEMPGIDAEAKREPGDGKTAMQVAAQHPNIVALFTTPEVKFLFLKKKLEIGKTETAAKLFAEIYHDGSPDALKFLQEIRNQFAALYRPFWVGLMPKIINRAVEKDDVELIIHAFSTFPELINEEILQGQTLLQLAVVSGNFHLVKSLVETFKHIDLDLRCTTNGPNKGATALLLALSSAVISPQIAKYLIDCGADLTIPSLDGKTPLHAALCREDKDLIDLLLNANKNLNINQPLLSGTHKGSTALITAAERSDEDTFLRLLAVPGNKINLKNAKGESALFVAAMLGDEIKIKTLLTIQGIDVSAKRNDGKTAAQIAEENGHLKIAALLNFYHLILTILNRDTASAKIKLDYLQQLDNKNLELIFQRVADLGYDKETISYVASFFERLKESEEKSLSLLGGNGFFKDPARRNDHTKILNHLFSVAHNNYYANHVDWEKKIRDTAKSDLKDVSVLPNKQNFDFLTWLRSQTIFSQHRHAIALGRTGAQRHIDTLIKDMRPKLKNG